MEINKSKYIIITCVKNEEDYIENTIKCIISQTIKPVKWVIVNDGSTDNTGNIVNGYVHFNEFIELINLPPKKERDFSSKIRAFNKGLEKIKGINFDFIGNLDGDISFSSDYYEKIMGILNLDKKLGIAGGKRVDIVNGQEKRIKSSNSSVCGAVMFFKKACFYDIGGYIPLKRGGEDAYIELNAKLLDWDVKSFPDIKIIHHKPTGYSKGLFLHKFNIGVMNYSLGYYFIYELFICFYRILEYPAFIGSIIRLLGYLWGYLNTITENIPTSFRKQVSKYQKNKIISQFTVFHIL